MNLNAKCIYTCPGEEKIDEKLGPNIESNVPSPQTVPCRN